MEIDHQEMLMSQHLAAGTAGRNRIINKVFLRSGGDSKCDDGLVGVSGVGIEQCGTFRAESSPFYFRCGL